MGSAVWWLCLTTCLAAAPVSAQTLSPLPPPPAFDGTPIASEKPLGAALKAIGPLADSFIDHSINPPFFVGPQDVWVAKFLTKPRMWKPGLCVERLLIVPLRLTRTPDKQATWQAHNVHWADQMRVVGKFDGGQNPDLDTKAEAICSDLEPFKPITTYGLLSSDSVEQAWQAGLALERIAAAARSPDKLPFSFHCRRSGDKDPCDGERRALAGLTVAKLWNVAPCDTASAGCIILNVAAPGDFGEDYWKLTLKLTAAASVDASDVTMEFVVPPVA